MQQIYFQASLQITDYVDHGNKASKRESIISVSEAGPLHPTHTVEKVDLVGVLLCLVKSSLGAANLFSICFYCNEGGVIKSNY